MKINKYLFPIFCSAVFAISFARAELSEQVQADLLKHDLVTAVKSGDNAKIIDAVTKMRSKNIDAGYEVYFYEARAYFALGQNQAGDAALEKYLEVAGPQGANYKTAIAMLSDRLEKREQEQKERELTARRREQVKQQWAQFNASLQEIGKVESVNTDWGYAKVSLSETSIPDGSYLFIALPSNQLMPVVSGKLSDKEITLTGIDTAQIPMGSILMISSIPPPGNVKVRANGAIAAPDFFLVNSLSKETQQISSADQKRGARVIAVQIGSSAHQAGIVPGDVIVLYGSEFVENAEKLSEFIVSKGTETSRIEIWLNHNKKVVRLMVDPGPLGAEFVDNSG